MKTIEAAQIELQNLQRNLQHAYNSATTLAQLFVAAGIDETQIDMLVQEVYRASGRALTVQSQFEHANK